MSQAFDTDSAMTPAVLAAAKAAGTLAVILYSRNLSPAAVKTVAASGLKLVVVWENGEGADPAYYTAANGIAAADRMIAQVTAAGLVGPGTLYLVAADFDANSVQVAKGTVPFFEGFNSVAIPQKYSVGSYGNGLLNQTLADQGLATYHWLWGVRSSYGSAAFLAGGKWHLHQHATLREFGLSVDPDDINPAFIDDYGGWGFAA
jgi:glycoside hydrolase-like protein